MELKRVEIIGFKSFPDKVRVEFGEGVTAIVGPNGSGKSNIADAVRWVLGEQSAKTLRGSKMEDVIFAGTERRKPLGFAQVTLVLDNRDRKMSVDYEEVAISRRIYRSGESEYAINGGRCRLRDVQEMLMDTGIGKDGYSLIGQGQIDQLLSSKPQDRRMIFEEAAGITKFKTRRDQAQKQLADEAGRLDRVSDILNELNSRIEPLRQQSEAAKKYLELRDELKLYEVSSFIGEYEQLKAQYDRVEALLSDLEEQIASSKALEEAAREKSEQLARSVDENRRRLLSLNQELSDLKLSQESGEGDKRVLLEQISHYQEDMESLQIRLDELKTRISDRTRTLEKEENKSRSLDEKISEQSEAQKKLEEQSLSQQKENELQGAAVQKARKELTEAEDEYQFASVEYQRYELLSSQDKDQLENSREEISGLQARKAGAEQALQELDARLAGQQKEFDDLSERLKKAEDRYSQDKKLQDDKRRQQESLMLQLKDMQGKIGWLNGLNQDYEGFSGSVKALMKLKKAQEGSYEFRLGGSIHGTLADLIHVKKEYSVALDVALGAALQNVVVDNTSGAKSLISYLRDKRIGRATFLPLDSVTARGRIAAEKEILAMPGVIGFADTLVETKDIYRKILSRQLGGVVVAKDFDSASRVSRAHGQVVRVVTLDGDIFNIGGSITGGSNHQQKSGILSRKAEMDDLRESLAVKRKEGDQLFHEIRDLGFALASQASGIAELKNSLTRLEQSRQETGAAMDQYRFQIEEVERRLQEVSTEGDNVLKIHQEHQEAFEKSKERLQKAADNRSGLQEKLKQEEQKLHELEETLAGTKQRIQELTLRLNGLKQEKQFMLQQIQWETGEIETLTTEAESIIDESAGVKESLEKAQKDIVAIGERQEKIRLELEEKQQLIHKQEVLFEQVDEQRESALKETEELLRNFSGLEKEQVRLENQSSRAKKDLDDLQDRMWEDYQITYGAAKELAARGFNDDEDMQAASELSKTKRRQKISQLKEEIKKLGPVNVAAITEYQSLTERVEFLSRQRDDILQSEQNLQDIILQMTSKMEEQFKAGFASIAASFDQVFKLMFGGGQGILRLTEGEDSLEAGIEIIAQPPGKKLQSMLLLSGGERALTAIALLFAIQQLNPAPFCILDEIEAALDDANVERYARYLKKMCSSTQFIVITHRKGTMVAADTMYGVTMEEKGVSKCISVNFDSKEQEELYGAV